MYTATLNPSPLLGITNTQRAERMFRTLKHYTTAHFPQHKPLLRHLIPYIVPCLEEKFLHREIKCTNRTQRIYHPNTRY